MDVIRSFFIEPDLSTILSYLGIDYKKAMKNRIMISIVIFIIFIFLAIYYKMYYLFIVSVIAGIGYYKYQYISVKNRKKKVIALKRRMFPAFVKKILILIRTNNIYNSLVKMIEYTDDPIKTCLQDLIEEIKIDKSIKPFNNFASKMEFIEAHQIMSMLYTFSEHSMNKKHLVSLETMISKLYDNEIDEVIETKKRLLWLYPNFTILTMLAMVFSLAVYMFVSILSEVSF